MATGGPYRLYIIDGTGAWSNDGYAADMRHSFCRQLADLAGGNAFYSRGPTNAGVETMSLAMGAQIWLAGERKRNSGMRLFLAGYSRGAAAAILAARNLRRDGIDVEAAFLFDAVLMHWGMTAHTLPPNVRHVYHIMRPSPEVAAHRDLISRYEGALSEAGRAANPFRPDWGNCGRFSEDPVRTRLVSMRLDIGTHGALGGVGWNGVDHDNEAQERTAAMMNAFLALHGLPSGLKSLPIDAQLPVIQGGKSRKARSRLPAGKPPAN